MARRQSRRRKAFSSSGNADDRERDRSTYEAIVERLVASGDAEHGTIMRAPCLRRNGEFVAMLDHHDTEGLVIKLPTERVQQLVDTGVATPFSDGARVHREWVAIPGRQRRLWATLVEESLAFAAARS